MQHECLIPAARLGQTPSSTIQDLGFKCTLSQIKRPENSPIFVETNPPAPQTWQGPCGEGSYFDHHPHTNGSCWWYSHDIKMISRYIQVFLLNHCIFSILWSSNSHWVRPKLHTKPDRMMGPLKNNILQLHEGRLGRGWKILGLY